MIGDLGHASRVQAEPEREPDATCGLAVRAVRFDRGVAANFQDVLGMEFTEASGDRVVITCKVRPELHQPYGILLGGVYCSLVESAASIGAALWFGDQGNVVGVANTTNFIRATREGGLKATATPLQRGRTQQLWQVEVLDDTDRLVAHGQGPLGGPPSPPPPRPAPGPPRRG